MMLTAEALGGVATKTIIVVGAFMPARFAESDAPFNRDMAFAAAQLAAAGTWIAINGTIVAARDVRKDRAANAFVPLDPVPGAKR